MTHLEEKWKQALQRICDEIQHTNQLSETVIAKIKMLQHAAIALNSAADCIDSCQQDSDNSTLIEQMRVHDDNVKLLIRYMILKDIIFKRSATSSSTS